MKVEIAARLSVVPPQEDPWSVVKKAWGIGHRVRSN